MFSNYAPADIVFAPIANTNVNLNTLQCQQVGLADALNTVTQSILDNSGRHWEWRVDGDSARNKVAYVNPVQFNSSTAIYGTFPGDFLNYQLRDTYRGIKNMLVVYGGTDPLLQTKVWGAFMDSVSISEYGVRQSHLENQYLVSQTQLNQYATAQLAISAYPVYTGQFDMVRATAKARGGVWFNISEPYGVIKQVRAGRVTVTWQKSMLISQTVEVNAPLPGIDAAIYNVGQNARAGAAQMTSTPKTTSLGTYSVVVAGGGLLSTQ